MTVGPVNLFEYESLASQRLPKPEYDFIAGGATDEITVRRTRTVFNSIMLRPRMLTDISQPDLSTTVLGQRIDFPVMAAPAGSHGRAHSEGELATARAAASVGTLMFLSSGSSHVLEDVAKASDGPKWFQQYFYRDREMTLDFALRAQEAGFTALGITVDSIGGTKRERNIRNSYVGKPSPNYAKQGITRQEQMGGLMDKAATWADFEWLMSRTPLPVVVKGIMTAEDARLCVEHGAKALVVSNHGGRQLDTTLASIEALPEIVDAVEDRLEVYLDGGIRRGTDVLKALALGARALLVGRPLFWGLAVDGEQGVRGVLQMLRDELDGAMGMCGRSTIASIDRSVITTVSPLVSALVSPFGGPLP